MAVFLSTCNDAISYLPAATLHPAFAFGSRNPKTHASIFVAAPPTGEQMHACGTCVKTTVFATFRLTSRITTGTGRPPPSEVGSAFSVAVSFAGAPSVTEREDMFHRDDITSPRRGPVYQLSLKQGFRPAPNSHERQAVAAMSMLQTLLSAGAARREAPVSISSLRASST